MATLSPDEMDSLSAPKRISIEEMDSLTAPQSSWDEAERPASPYQFTPPPSPADDIKLDPYQKILAETGYPDPSKQSFEEFQKTHPNPSMVTAQKLLPLADTPEKKNYLANFIQQKTAPELPVGSVAGDAFQAFNQGPMSTLGIPEKLSEIQDLRRQNAEQTKLYNESIDKLSAQRDQQAPDETPLNIPEHKAAQSKFVNFAIGQFVNVTWSFRFT